MDNFWKERLIEETKKGILQEAREKLSDYRSIKNQSTSLESQERLRKIKRLEDLQRNYEYLQKELFPLKNQLSSNSQSLNRAGKVAQEALDTINSSINRSDRSSAFQNHLEHMQSLQLRAKKILEKERLSKLAEIKESQILTEKVLRKKRQEKVQLSIPVYVPQSSIRKEKHLPPTMVNKVISSGEVMPVYMVGEPIPRYDPLVKVEKLIPSHSYNQHYRDSVDATAHSNHELSVDSVFYYRIFKNSKAKNNPENATPQPSKELVEAKIDRQNRPVTPTGLPHAWMFRELEYDKINTKPKRHWVKERMNRYYQDRVKKDFVPKTDINKSLEIKLALEKNFPAKNFEKIKFFNCP